MPISIGETNSAAAPLTSPELNTLLNGPGNHESQTLIAGILATHPETEFSDAMLHSDIRQRQAGQANGWIPHSQGPGKACRMTLAPIGMVTQEAVIGRLNQPIDAWKATDFGRRALPFVGAMSEWSLNYPEASVQQILGATSSSGAVRSPAVRHAIYATLLTAPDDDHPSYDDIAVSTGDKAISRKLVESQCRDLEDLGILSIVSKLSDDYNPSFRILDAGYHHVQLPFEQLEPASQLFYKVLAKLNNETTDSTHTLSDLLASAQRIDPHVDMHAIRRLFIMGTSEKTSNLPGIQIAESAVDTGQLTVVNINDKYAPMLQDLIQRLTVVQDGTNDQSFSDMARKIVNTPTHFAALMGKAKRFSPAYIAQIEGREGLERRITNVVRRLGGGSAKLIRQQLEESGRRLTRDVVQSALGELVSRGVLAEEQVQTSESKQARTTHYAIGDPPSST